MSNSRRSDQNGQFRRRDALKLAAAGLATTAVGYAGAARAQAPVGKRPFVLIHGAWHGGWAWRPVTERLWRAGHAASSPTLAGLGERAHLVSPEIGLDVHVQDVIAHMEMEDLRDVVLVGHSYGGMVIAGVLAQAPGRVQAAVFLDALVPESGKGLADYIPPKAKQNFEKLHAEGKSVPPRPPEMMAKLWGLTDPKVRDWVAARLRPQSPLTFLQPVKGEPMRDGVRYTFIRCEANPNPLFQAMGDKVKGDARWTYVGLDTHHDAMLLAPDALTEALLSA